MRRPPIPRSQAAAVGEFGQPELGAELEGLVVSYGQLGRRYCHMLGAQSLHTAASSSITRSIPVTRRASRS